MRAANTVLKTSEFAAAVIVGLTLAASAALAHHDGNTTGGASIGAIVPIIAVVVLGMIGLGFWGRKKRKPKSKRKQKRR